MLIVCYRAWIQDMGQAGIEQCWLRVNRWGGWMETHIMSIDFYVPEQYSDFIILAHPELERRPLRDYVK